MVEEAVQRKNPFVGPQPFTRGDTLFGRERETDDLFSLLIAGRIVLMYGASGTGKTSLIQAALIPRMIEEGFTVLDNLRVNLEPEPSLATAAGRNRYVYSVIASLEDARLQENDRDGSDGVPDSMPAELGLDRYLKRDHPKSPSLLIFDQFEEILTLNPIDIHAKKAFFDQLGQALQDPTRWALFSMREDYRAALDPYVEPLPTRFKNTYRLDLLQQATAIEVIRSTALQAEVDFQEPAARKLVEDLSRVQVMRFDGTMESQLGPFVEPVQLQVVCFDLFERQAPEDPDITEEEVEEIGDVDKALGRYYARQVQTIASEADFDRTSVQLTARQAARRTRKSSRTRAPAKNTLAERVIRDWFDQQLITPAGVRDHLLMGAGSSAGLDNRIVDRLEDAHLVRKDYRRGRTWIELAHDRLVGPVRRQNANWFQAQRWALLARAAPWLIGGTLALIASLLLGDISAGIALLVGWSVLIATLSYLLITQLTDRLAAKERRYWIYKGGRVLAVILTGLNFWLVLIPLAGFLLGPLTIRLLALSVVVTHLGLSALSIATSYAVANFLAKQIVRLRLPHELGFIAIFLVLSFILFDQIGSVAKILVSLQW